MKKLIFLVILVFITTSLFVSAVQKEMAFPGTNITSDFVQQDIHFGKGWNLVQGILNPEWVSNNKNSIKAIYAYNPIVREYVRFYPNPEHGKIG
jgi:hypothetical protein